MKIAVIGGGAAGLFAAGVASHRGADVTVFEKNDRPGVKLRITGKGRCNVTNDCDRDRFFDSVVSNPRFLYSAYSALTPQDVMAFFERLGVPLKTERGGRVFPVSDKASDIVDALVRYCGAVTFRHEKVLGIRKEDEFEVKTSKGVYRFDRVIIATGGLSYPRTGSDGDGYGFAAAFGHRIIGTSPSLVPLICEEDLCPRCQGLTLKNVTLSALDTSKNKTVFSELGEMLFTDKGVSGPLVLSASAHMKDITPGKYALYIDLKPALDEQTLDRRILRDFSEQKNKNLINSLHDLLPSKLIAPFVELTGIDPDKKVNSVTVSERRKILELLKKLPLTVVSAAPVAEAIITRGGVDTRQIDPKTMQSKLVPGLYFAGEVIDCDAYTGGFNLQIAFSTANAAAVAASGVIT
ncbi:MAG: NAD(P)/FAD-dependent oxidoreductase [Clostridia bacterium]|nr:NAD(P)/FAD-dependent oxidoreductase [Clostridia bacterium]